MVASLPSEWGMLVYKDDTSIDANRHSSGSRKPSIRFINPVVSLMNEGSFLISGCSQMSTHCEMFSVILLQLEIMGRIPIGFLWIFFKKRSCVLWGHTDFLHFFIQHA